MIRPMRTPSFIFSAAFFAAWVWSVVPANQSTHICRAEAPAAETTASAQSPTLVTVEQKVDRYRTLIERMREEIRLITESKIRFYLDGREASYDWKDQWETAVAALEPLKKEFETIATDLFINHTDDASVPDSLEETVFAIRRKLLKTDQDAKTIAVLRRLLETKPENQQLKLDLGRVLLKTNQFAEANELIDSIPRNVMEDLDDGDDKLLASRSQLETTYEEEKKILAAESEADDLPRVELLTSQGPVVVELFENEAPDTVGNFIHLVESGFYKDVIFHRVIAGFMAQTGLVARLENGYANKRPGYLIYDETRDGRRHFSGYLSMAKTDKPNTGNSQFFITYQPTNFLDGRHTVFGRVIEGMENVGRLQATFEMKKTEKDKPPEEVRIESAIPDFIKSANVIRKRDHQYAPKKVGSN